MFIALYVGVMISAMIFPHVCASPLGHSFSKAYVNDWLQGKYSKQTLKDIGTFLRYMETENNVKVMQPDLIHGPNTAGIDVNQQCSSQSFSAGVVQQ